MEGSNLEATLTKLAGDEPILISAKATCRLGKRRWGGLVYKSLVDPRNSEGLCALTKSRLLYTGVTKEVKGISEIVSLGVDRSEVRRVVKDFHFFRADKGYVVKVHGLKAKHFLAMIKEAENQLKVEKKEKEATERRRAAEQERRRREEERKAKQEERKRTEKLKPALEATLTKLAGDEPILISTEATCVPGKRGWGGLVSTPWAIDPRKFEGLCGLTKSRLLYTGVTKEIKGISENISLGVDWSEVRLSLKDLHFFRADKGYVVKVHGVKAKDFLRIIKEAGKVIYVGKYLTGHPEKSLRSGQNVKLALDDEKITITGFLGTPLGFIPLKAIKDVKEEDASSERFTATRLLLVGVFALAFKKKKKAGILTIKWEQSPGISYETMFLSSAGYWDPRQGFSPRAVAAINEARSKLGVVASVQPDTNKDIPSQIRELAKLKDEGLLNEKEFQAKKEELLGRM